MWILIGFIVWILACLACWAIIYGGSCNERYYEEEEENGDV